MKPIPYALRERERSYRTYGVPPADRPMGVREAEGRCAVCGRASVGDVCAFCEDQPLVADVDGAWLWVWAGCVIWATAMLLWRALPWIIGLAGGAILGWVLWRMR